MLARILDSRPQSRACQRGVIFVALKLGSASVGFTGIFLLKPQLVAKSLFLSVTVSLDQYL